MQNHKPFLKWAGSKFKNINRLRNKLPTGKRLIEPFLGSAAVFLNTDYDEYFLADNNQNLINVYQVLQNYQADFIKYTKNYFNPKNNTKQRFLALREQYNQLAIKPKDSVKKAALFIYLNRHCFNGLYSGNLKGVFNAALGDYKKLYFPDLTIMLKNNILACTIVSRLFLKPFNLSRLATKKNRSIRAKVCRPLPELNVNIPISKENANV